MSVNPVAAGFIEAQTLCAEFAEAQGRLRAAWALYEHALARLGPYPNTTWGERKLAEREKAVSTALAGVRKCGVRLARVGVGSVTRASGRSARLAHERIVGAESESEPAAAGGSAVRAVGPELERAA